MSNIRILAVGTELTDGQVVDANSAWLSRRFTDFGYVVSEHRTLPDDRKCIEACLKAWLTEPGAIVVTGGLGPTSDDFTRECVAKCLDLPLDEDAKSLARINERLRARGVKMTENQRSQALFPRGAEILNNENGTAHGFWIERKKTASSVGVWDWMTVLPGPPSEIAAIWRDGLSARAQSKAPLQNSRKLILFKTLGRGEGAIADETEKILNRLEKGGTHPRIEVGYRANIPYVELKFWLAPEAEALETDLRSEVQSAFSSLIVGEGDFDFVDSLIDTIQSGSKRLVIQDEVTKGILFDRLRSRSNAREININFDKFTYVTGPAEVTNERRDDEIHFCLRPGATRTEMIVELNTKTRIELPALAISLDHDRGRRWACELALQIFHQSMGAKVK